MKKRVGILHPGEMGVSIAASAQNSGHPVYWVSEGRSDATQKRAESIHLLDAGKLAHLCAECSLIISVCPPHAAETIANLVLATKFGGLYLDANAISPQRAKRIDQAMRQAGIGFVDGGIIGGPAWKPHQTFLYLSGPRADEVAECFEKGPLETRVLGSSIGPASALKMCYSAYAKGTTALLCAVLAAAERLEVYDALGEQWNHDGEGFTEDAARRVRGSARKAWRFEGEMGEIATTFQEAGLPGDFHSGAAEIYRRLAGFQGSPATPPLKDVLDALLIPPG